MADSWLVNTCDSYDADVDGSADNVQGLLDANPCLRASLALSAELVRDAGGGAVADIGCGLGYVTRHLHDLGIDAFGIDPSPEMIALARRDHPDVRFELGTMTDLDVADGSLGGVLAFWSVIHVPDHSVPGAFAEFRRVMRRARPLLVRCHVGDEVRHTAEGYSGRSISVESYRRPPAKVAQGLREAGFTIEAELVMRPDEEVPGAIILARSAA
jgi:SAM-dependent methyltransferase